MKKYFVFLVFFSFITCLKSFSQESDFVIARNPELTIQADNGILIIANDVYSRKSALKRNIRLVHPKTKEVIGEVFIRLESSNPDEDLYTVLKESPGQFSGSLTIESGAAVYRKQIVSGVAESGQVTAGRTAGELGGGPGCTLTNIHNCVSNTIEGMSWWRFGLCLLSAPACYARTWVFCTIQVCL